MEEEIREHGKYLKTLIEYLNAQGHASIADIIKDCVIVRDGSVPGSLLEVLFGMSKGGIFIKLSPAAYHLVMNNKETKKILIDSLQTVMGYNQASKFGIRMKVG